MIACGSLGLGDRFCCDRGAPTAVAMMLELKFEKQTLSRICQPRLPALSRDCDRQSTSGSERIGNHARSACKGLTIVYPRPRLQFSFAFVHGLFLRPNAQNQLQFVNVFEVKAPISADPERRQFIPFYQAING